MCVGLVCPVALGEADADRDGHTGSPLHVEDLGRDRLAETVRGLQGFAIGHVGQDDGEFLAAEARDEIAAPQVQGEAARDLPADIGRRPDDRSGR